MDMEQTHGKLGHDTSATVTNQPKLFEWPLQHCEKHNEMLHTLAEWSRFTQLSLVSIGIGISVENHNWTLKSYCRKQFWSGNISHLECMHWSSLHTISCSVCGIKNKKNLILVTVTPPSLKNTQCRTPKALSAVSALTWHSPWSTNCVYSIVFSINRPPYVNPGNVFYPKENRNRNRAISE